MKNKDQILLIIVAGLAILALFFLYQKNVQANALPKSLNTSSGVNPNAPINGFTPGAYNITVNNNPGNTTINSPNFTIDVNPNVFAFLSEKYIPLFGFVGVYGGQRQYQ